MVYSFECKDCGNVFDKNLSVSDFEKFKEKEKWDNTLGVPYTADSEVKVNCTKCDSSEVENIITGGGHFKRFWNKL